MRLLLFLILIQNLFASETDTIPRYLLDEISVEGTKILETKIITSVDEKSIHKTDGTTLAEISKLLPSIKMQTNSRGEAMLHLRGAGERQVMIFFDGIPLNTPWDNRIDVGLIPVDAVAGMELTRGIPSVLYGANAMTGVINLQSFRHEKNSNRTRISFFGGQNKEQYYTALHSNAGEDYSFIFSSSYYKTDGYDLPSGFSNTLQNSALRIRSDKKSFNIFGKGDYQVTNRTKLGVTAMFVETEKGVPFEIDVANPRFWHYPEWKNYTIAVNGEHVFNTFGPANLTFSFSSVKQSSSIEQFTDITYSQIDDIEISDDRTFNGSIIFTQLIKKNSLLKFGLSGFTSTHKEKFLSDDFTTNIYEHNIFSGGIEYEYFTKNFITVVGIGFDASETPMTGDKESKKGITDYAFNLGTVYSPEENISLHISFGRKTRFPTMRESFSGALGRFVPNPDLKAESGYTGEVGAQYYFPFGEIKFNFFLSYLNDGIVRVTLPGRQFQRINKDQIRTGGAEASYKLNFMNNRFSTTFNFTYLNASAKSNDGSFSDTLEYKPVFLAFMNFVYNSPIGLNGLLEISYTGKEFALKEGGIYFQRIPDYFITSARLSYHYNFTNKLSVEIFGRVDNIFDKLYYRQWGLPEAGRNFIAGLTLTI